MTKYFEFGDWILDRPEGRLLLKGEKLVPVKLETKKLVVLTCLVEHAAGQPRLLMLKDDLVAKAWDGAAISDSTLSAAVSRLRTVLGDDHNTPKYIETVHGKGFRFISDVVAHKEKPPSLASYDAAAGNSSRATEPNPSYEHLQGPLADIENNRGQYPPLDLVLDIPRRSWNSERMPPGALLRAECAAVPFHGRNLEMSDLEMWCESDAGLGIRLYTGAGGMGKTRLLIEVCARLAERGWRAGFLRPEADNVRPDWWSSVFQGPSPLFVVVDYAETRRAEVVSLLSGLGSRPGRCRIVMLAREAGDWWNELKRERGGAGDLLMGPMTQLPHGLQPLAMESNDRESSFWTAAGAFARVLGKAVPSSLTKDIDAEYYGRVLILQMSALAAVEGVQVKGDQGILHYVIERERRYWAVQAKARGLSPTLNAGLAQAMTVITLIGGTADKLHTRRVLKTIPLLVDQSEVVRGEIATILRDAYPGSKKWIEPILPDLLGEHLVQEELGKEKRLLRIAFNSRPRRNPSGPPPYVKRRSGIR